MTLVLKHRKPVFPYPYPILAKIPFIGVDS